MKKTIVLVVLFVLPIVAYLFFASGINHFGHLPVLTPKVSDVSDLDPNISLNNKITVVGFLGRDVAHKKGNAFNLNQKIYKPYYGFKDFQFVMVMPKGTESMAAEIKDQLGAISKMDRWHFVFGDDAQIQKVFDGLGTNLELDANMYTPYVFIVDKNLQLRGRKDDEEEGIKYGFRANSVAELSKKMEDDIKIILAEYRLELKKNNLKK